MFISMEHKKSFGKYGRQFHWWSCIDLFSIKTDTFKKKLTNLLPSLDDFFR